MFSLTANEARIIELLVRNWSERLSMNEVAKRTRLSPRGAYKILTKLETKKVLLFEHIGQAKYYALNWNEPASKKIAEVILAEKELPPYASVCADDLRALDNSTDCTILFGSVLSKGTTANDIDVFCIIQKEQYLTLRRKIRELQDHSTRKIHLVTQTLEDTVKNLKKKEPVLLNIIKTGVILHGQDVILGAIQKCQQ